MATNRNALWRLRILDELLANEWLTVKELTDKVDDRLKEECRALGIDPPYDEKITERCIRSDLDYLENRSPWVDKGISDDDDTSDEETLFERAWVVCKNPERSDKVISLRKYRYRNRGFSIFMPRLSAEEQDILRAALSIIGQFDGLPIFNGLDKLNKSLNLKPKEKILSVTHNPLADSTILGELYMAISSKSVIELNYFLFGAPQNIKTILFHPYLLKEYNGRWYVIGAADSDMKILNFALDRVASVNAVKSKPYRAAPIDIEEWCEDVIGVTVDETSPIHDILFWVSDKSKHYVTSKPLHLSQKRHKTDEAKLRQTFPSLEGGWFFTIQCRMNYELIRELTSFGAELIVLSPDEVRDKITERLKKMMQRYGTFGT